MYRKIKNLTVQKLLLFFGINKGILLKLNAIKCKYNKIVKLNCIPKSTLKH